MSFADKELLQVRQYVFFVFLPSFLKNFWSEAKQSPTVIVVWAAALLKWILLNRSGLFALPLLQLLDMKIFVDADSDIRLVRRLRRDITERGRDIEGVIKQYNKFVKPAFEQYIEPTMRLADIVVPRGKTIRLSHHTFDLLLNMQANNFSKCTHLFCSFVPRRWWEHGGHWSDSPACSQPAGGGEWPQHWWYIRGWRHRVSESCNILTEGENKELQADMKSECRTHHILLMVHIVVQKLSPTRHYGWRSNLNCFRLYWSFDVVYLSVCLNRP